MVFSVSCRYHRTAICLAWLCLINSAAFASVVVESGPGGAAGLSWTALRVDYQLAGDDLPGWRLAAEELILEETGAALGDIRLSCPGGSVPRSRMARHWWPECPAGTLYWQSPGEESLDGEFRSYLDAADVPVLEVELDEPEVKGKLVLQAGGIAADISARELPLDLLAGPVSGWLTQLEGRLTASVRYRTEGAGELHIAGNVAALGFDTPDGSFAAADVAMEVDARLGARDAGWHFEGEVTQSAGEWLLGPVYVPAPEQAVRLDISGRLSDERLEIERLQLDDPGTLNATAGLALALGDEVRLLSFDLPALEMHLPDAQRRYLNGLLAEFALDDLETDGLVTGSGRIDEQGLDTLDLTLGGVVAEDARDRFGVRGLSGGLRWRRGSEDIPGDLQVDLDWVSAGIYNIPLGASRLRLSSEDGHLFLDEPLAVPVFDGAVRIDRLQWHDWRGEGARLDLDARLEPVDFSLLSEAVGWPALGGSVSGSIPRVIYADNTLAFEGGVEIKVFSGRIDVRNLAVERPLGSLPGLAADVELSDLDLLEVTGAFGFGRMEGRLAGSIDGLRMLNWQPVALDARLETVETRGVRQRISQRAVDDLASLGGGGSALAAPLLKFFEDFAYRKAGLSCRLSNNVCRMGGVGEAEEGGFFIVQGRGLPHLNIIGHRRLVDWPRLVHQLQSATEAEVR